VASDDVRSTQIRERLWRLWWELLWRTDETSGHRIVWLCRWVGDGEPRYYEGGRRV
jgi:hypothetical protein